jgi:protein-tyrosine phosphatase
MGGSHRGSSGFCSPISEHIYLGKAPATDEDIRRLKDAGVTVILNLQEVSESPTPTPELKQNFKWRRIPTKDSIYGGIPDREWLDECTRRLEEWTQAGEKVYVHCLMGKGRSPLVVMTHLVLNEGMRLSKAIATTLRKHPRADPNVHQMTVMVEYVRERIVERERAAGSGRAMQRSFWPPEGGYDPAGFYPEDFPGDAGDEEIEDEVPF